MKARCMVNKLVSVATCVAVLVTSGTSVAQTPGDAATAEPQTAADYSAQAKVRFAAKDFDAAARLFEQAYGLDPNPNYLFNIGRVYEEKGDIRTAITYYQRFVQEPGVELDAREKAATRLKVLRAILKETEPTAPTEPEPEDPAPVQQVAPAEGPEPAPVLPPTSDAPDRRKTMRHGGYALIAVGAASVVVGGIFGGLTLRKKNELDASNIIEDRQSLAHTGRTYGVVADITLFTGAALLVTGVVLAVVARKPRTAARTSLVPSRGAQHTGVTWSLRF